MLSAQQELGYETIVFGGKKNLSDYSKGKITKEEYKKNRLMSVFASGKAADISGNRKFQLDLANNKVVFKPSRDVHIDVILPKLSKNQRKLLEQIEPLAKAHEAPVTYQLTNEHIFIIFDEAYCSTQPYSNFKKDRILSIDTNPNFLGITICDYSANGEQKIIHKEVISNALINNMDLMGLPSTDPLRKYQTNKRIHEGHEVAKYIVKLAKSYHCEYVAIEDLNIKQKTKTGDKKADKKSKRYRRLCNNMWNRQRMYAGIKKWCSLKNIKLREVPPQYSSFIGCLNHPEEYDMIAAALEIGRRANAFISTYITKIKNQAGRIIYPRLPKKNNILNRWKEEGLTDKDLGSWIDLYNWAKNTESSYRVLLDVNSKILTDKSFRLFSSQSKLLQFRL